MLFRSDLGANEWLVDEMLESYLKDPNSVDPAWVEYFKKNGKLNGATIAAPVASQAVTQVSNPLTGAPKGGTPPVPNLTRTSDVPFVLTPLNITVIRLTPDGIPVKSILVPLVEF